MEKDELKKHYLLEKRYAEDIAASAKGSEERRRLISGANDDILELMSAYNEGGAFSHDGGFVAALVSSILPKGSKVLDFGCGRGDLVSSLSRSGYDISGFDVAETNIISAKERLKKQGLSDRVFVGDYSDIDGAYDAIIMDNVIEHLVPDETKEVLDKCYQLLKKNGVILVITPHRFAGPHDISRNFLPLGARAEGFHFFEYTVSDLGTVLENSGFRDIANYLIHPKMLWKSGLSMKPRKIYYHRSVFMEKIFRGGLLARIFKINRNLSRGLVALMFPTVVVGRK